MTRFVPTWLALSIAGFGCTTHTITPPVTVTTKPLPQLSTKGARGTRVAGESCTHVILLLIPVGSARSEEAYAEALGKAPGADALVGDETRSNILTIIPFYHRFCTEVHGDAVRVKDLAAGGQPVTP